MKKSSFLFLIIFLTGCVDNKQEQWLYENFQDKIWYNAVTDAYEAEFQRLSVSLRNYANEAIEDYRGRTYFPSWDGSWGNGYSSASSRNNEIAKYKEHSEKALKRLHHYLLLCKYLREEEIPKGPYYRSDAEIFELLMGRPYKIPHLEMEDEVDIADGIAIKVSKKLLKSKPILCSVEYKWRQKLWLVRMDNADNQYVKFYPREDGKYDVEYGNNINADGDPINGKKIIVKL